jgi:hypothetical protein
MKRFLILISVVPLTVGPTFVFSQEKDLPELNRKVLEFARENKGKKVGDGECWTLAAEALKAAQARGPRKLAAPGEDGKDHYTDFGRKLEGKEKILPGDLVQFEKAKVVNGTNLWFFPQHTAIVFGAKGRKLTLIHQNYNGKRLVFTMPLDLAGLREGTVEIYRPEE